MFSIGQDMALANVIALGAPQDSSLPSASERSTADPLVPSLSQNHSAITAGHWKYPCTNSSIASSVTPRANFITDSLFATVSGSAFPWSLGQNSGISRKHSAFSTHFSSSYSATGLLSTAGLPATSTKTQTLNAATVTVSCYHRADPDNTCTAIANSKGWCSYNKDGEIYANSIGGKQPCADYTVLPPRTFFDCPSTTVEDSVPTCVESTPKEVCFGHGSWRHCW